MKRKLALIATTALVTTTIDYRVYKKMHDKTSASYQESLKNAGNIMYSLGKIHGALTAQRAMQYARPIVEDRQYVAHTMN